MNVVIYARYSSHSQTEQSIEGQLHIPVMSMLKTTAISLSESISTVPRAEPPTAAQSSNG